ncbi:unnamed protein product [Rhizophagus irregularis]|nr:unnamed protein product [Rhizophagus irregularis]
MSSELELSKQRIAELEAENVNLRRKLSVSDAEIAELKRSNNEFLRANKEHNERRDAENAKLRATIEELKSENIEVRDRLTKVEQNQLQNEPRDTSHNSSNNNSSNFNLVAIPEAITVPTNSAKRHNGKSLKEKDMDQFLLEAHKKIVSSEIKQCNKEKKLKKAEQASLNQDQESGTSNPERIIPAVSNPVTKISAGAPLPKNSHRKKGRTDVIVAKFAWNFSGKLRIIPVNWGKLCYNFGIMEVLQFGKFCQNGGIPTEFLIQMLRNFSVNYH